MRRSPLHEYYTPLWSPPAPPQPNPCNTAVSTAPGTGIHQLQGRDFAGAAVACRTRRASTATVSVFLHEDTFLLLELFGAKIKWIGWKKTLQNSCGTTTGREYGVLLLNVLFMYMNSRLKALHTHSHTWVCIFQQPDKTHFLKFRNTV